MDFDRAHVLRGFLVKKQSFLTTNHWGTYRAQVTDGKIVEMRAFEEDPDPSTIGQGIVDALDAPSRITAPMVRESWLQKGPGARPDLRGKEAFVEVSWPQVEELVANELTRVRREHGNNAIYAGSYGWASAGRFHHAQSQLKRFLNCGGGFTSSVHTYSFAAAEAMIPHVLGSYREFLNTATSWSSVAQEGELVVAFGGIPLKNGQIEAGGLGAHHQRDGVRAALAAGVSFVNISPLQQDMPQETNAKWLAARPNSDVALMLGLAHTVLSENLHDPQFLAQYTTGFDAFEAYLTGTADGVPKDADWAAGICDVSADDLRALARKMATSRTMISVSWSLTRQDHGEQPFWMAITLAAMLGQIGKPGGGFVFGYSASNSIGADYALLSGGSFPQGQNGVADFIPVARVSDMLLNPGASVPFNGQMITYPDIQLVWWAGGNPYHHHQDLNRLAKAWEKPQTVICNEWCWNALAKRADIVLPCTTHVERDDVSMTQRDSYIFRTQKAVEPPGQARDDFDIFRSIAQRLNIEPAFSQGRSAQEWMQIIYEQAALSDGKFGDLASTEVANATADQPSLDLPNWEDFCKAGWIKVPSPDAPRIMLQNFVADPALHPLATPSGKIEIFSKKVAAFGYADCPGHPMWQAPNEWIGSAAPGELHLISNQPGTKLHSQLDQGAVSRAGKIDQREPVLFHPQDAAERGIEEGDVIRLFNDRGACLGSAQLSTGIRPGVVQMTTGAWWDPDETGMCQHGNPNALTRDVGTSQLGQGPTAHSCLVRAEKHLGKVPEMTAFDPPVIKRNEH
ncbi:MAG: molybdopterin guanine dinucleotide-containing S/N-oxide reductase [Sulfitobacter sp.]